MNTTSQYTHDEYSMRLSHRLKLRPYIDVVGTMSDADLGKLAGVSFKTARKYRRILGIAPFRNSIADKVAPHLDKLGHITDREFAALAGVALSSVGRLRMKYEISPAPRKPRVSQETTKRRRNRKPMIDASPWLHLLGVLPDGEVADMAGCNETTARNWRVRRGIPSAMDSRRMQREAAETPEMTARRERRRERSKGWSGTQLAVTKWAKAWDDEHDAPFLTTTYADAVGVSVATAVARIERAVKRGEITEIDRHDPKRGVCGCYVVAA